MEVSLFGIENLDAYLVLGILVFFSLIEAFSGYLSQTKRKFSDWIQEAGGFFALSLFIKPVLVGATYFLGRIILPDYFNHFASWGILIATCAYLFIDDVMQYWYHRSAHEYEFLWKLHRPHHQAEEMGFFVAYRNAGLYYILMPNLWWAGICTFIGLGHGVAMGLILKQVVIIGSHSTISWDKPMYNSKFLKPIVSILERIFITPAFHHAHHGKTMRDGISHPNGNFGNMFSLWDQFFGTATFTGKFPEEYGLENDPKEHWTAAYLWPAIKSKDPKSELSSGYEKVSTITNEPISVQLEKGQTYLYCRCGKSKNAPFCDSSHQGSKIKPLLFEAKRSGTVRLCNCKKTNAAPFCDDTHISLKEKIEEKPSVAVEIN